MPDLSVGSHTIRFEDNRFDGPAVIFCHSYSMDQSMFAPQLEHLSRINRCISWDQRAHGGSFTDRPFTLWDSANDAIALLDHLGIDRATFVGTNQGGFVSLRAALLAPRRVAGLAVLGSSASIERPMQKASYLALSVALQATRATGLPQFPFNFMRDLCFGSQFDAAAWVERWKRWPTAQLNRALEAVLGREDISHRLQEIQVPALVIHGSADAFYDLGVARKMAEGLANCHDFVVVNGGTHFLSITDPTSVNAALKSFLATVDYGGVADEISGQSSI